jgi:acyl dehydratase
VSAIDGARHDSGMHALEAYSVTARNIDPTSDNKIHDDDVARKFGFTGALVPGVELFAYMTHPLVRAWGVEFLEHGGIDVRFRKPVYDGDVVVASAEPGDDGTLALALTGPDGVVRAVGTASARHDGVLDADAFADTALPPSLPPAGPDSLRPGPIGSVREPVDAEALRSYLDAIGETLPVYRDEGVVHPGGLLRLVNAILVRNVALGPWIHTASSCRMLGVAHVPTTMVAHAIVTDNFDRGGHQYVRYDALVAAGEKPVMRVEHTAIYRIADSMAISD